MANHRLWAPWRLQYLKGEKSSDCIFCSKPALGDEQAFIVHRGSSCYVILNAFPYTNGHVMVAPYEHVGALEQLDDATAGEMIKLVQLCVRALSANYGPDGYTVGLNQGEIAGAGVADHVHLHVVPRWAGDTNFMPVVGDTRVLPEELGDSFRSLREAFGELRSAPGHAGA